MGKNIAEQVFAEELALIENEALKVAVTRYLNEAAPSYFWTAPSSSSGKHHSRFDAGEGGLRLLPRQQVRHHCGVFYCPPELQHL